MRDLVIVGLSGSYVASLGAMMDAYTMLAGLFAANEPLGAYSDIQTQLHLVTADGSPFPLAGGRQIPADRSWQTIKQPRLVYLPAFLVHDPSALKEALHARALHEWLSRLDADQTVFGASGASCLHLLAAGLLHDEPVSVPLRLVGEARRLFPHISIADPDTITTSGRIATCASPSRASELVLSLLADAISTSTANWLAIRQGIQAGLMSDPLIARAQLLLRERFAETISIADLAADLDVSHHTLVRRFKTVTGLTPSRYRQKARIEAAVTMFRETTRPVAEVGQLVGYSDMRTFREIFVRETGLTPSRFRAGLRKTPGQS